MPSSEKIIENRHFFRYFFNEYISVDLLEVLATHVQHRFTQTIGGSTSNCVSNGAIATPKYFRFYGPL